MLLEFQGVTIFEDRTPNIGATPNNEDSIFLLDILVKSIPHLPYTAHCGVVHDSDIKRSRQLYVRYGCSPESSFGKMVEGLHDEGPLVWEGYLAFDWLFRKYSNDLNILCADLKEADPACFGTQYLYRINDPHINKSYLKDCGDKWPKIIRLYDKIQLLQDSHPTQMRILFRSTFDLLNGNNSSVNKEIHNGKQ